MREVKLITRNDTNSICRVDHAANEGDVGVCFPRGPHGDRRSSDGLQGKRNWYRGFTLLEVLLAMVILSTGIILLVNSWSGAFLRIRKTKITTEIAFLLERKVTEYEMKYRGKPITTLADEEDDFGSEYPQYSWKAEVKDLEAPDITALVVPDDNASQKQMMQTIVKTLIEHLNKVIREVKITVTYKGGKKLKPLSHSVTTYFIDYDKEIQLPGLGSVGAAGVGP